MAPVALTQPIARAPFVCELAGMPRAGKTTTLVALQTRLAEMGFSVHAIDEGIRESPLRSAGLSTMNTAVWHQKAARLLGIRYCVHSDVVVVDRGPFDAIALSYLLQWRGDFSCATARAWRQLLLEQIARLDRVFLLVASPRVALDRDGRTTEEGAVMNLSTLTRWRAIYDRTFAMLARKEPSLAARVIRLDTTSLPVAELQTRVITSVEHDLGMEQVA